MKPEHKIKTGDFLVVTSTWKIEVHQAIRVTAKLIFYKEESWGRERFHRLRPSDIAFWGSAATAHGLSKLLVSSEARFNDELRSAEERHRERDKKLIREAFQTKAQAA